MNPKEVLHKWIDAFNSANALELSALYHDDAINHQVANDRVIGKKAIYEMFVKEFANTKMVCIPENIFCDGEWAMLEWKDPLGIRGCGFFHIIVGKIKLQRGYWDKLTFLRAHKRQVPFE